MRISGVKGSGIQEKIIFNPGPPFSYKGYGMVIKIWIGIGILFLLLTWWAVIDITKKDFGSIVKKALWGFTALIPFLGPVIYFVIGYRKGKKIAPNG